MPETPFRRARREFPRVLVDSHRMWFWLLFWGLLGTAAGAYFSYDHKPGALAGITAGAAAAGVFVALATAFGALWATAPRRLLAEKVESLAAAVAELQDREEHRPEPLRVALMAVRSELASCGAIIVEARTEQRWWRPHDALPATEWREQRAALADPALPSELHTQIESAYQTCHRLNQRINDYVVEHKEGQMVAASIGRFAMRMQ